MRSDEIASIISMCAAKKTEKKRFRNTVDRNFLEFGGGLFKNENL